jgi:integrase
MSKKLTVGSVEKLKPETSRREVPDAGCPGLYLVIQPTGAKSWSLRFRSPVERDGTGQRKAKKLTLGPLAIVPSHDDPKVGRPLTLVQARALATAAMGEVANHRDPTHARREERANEREKALEANTVEAAFAEFLRLHVRKKNGQAIRMSTRIATGGLLGLKPDSENAGQWVATKGGVCKRWGARPLVSITKADVRTLIDSVAVKAPVSANRTLAALRTFFNWCVKRDKLTINPSAGVDDPSPEEPRKRPLSEIEIAALWKAAEIEAYPYGRMVQLLLLTGCRRDEIREAPWGEINFSNGTWLIPEARTKNGHAHLLTLSDTVCEILEGLPRIKGAGLLFTTNGKTPFSGLSRAKRRLDNAMLAELRKTDPDAKLQPWRLHDLRHTLKTWMQQNRIAKDVRNAVQNHHDRDMDELYGHYSFEPEKRQALQGWADHVRQVVTGAGADSNVIPLQSAPK